MKPFALFPPERCDWNPKILAAETKAPKPDIDPKATTKLELHLQNGYLEGQWDLVSSLITPITHIVTLGLLIINLLTKSP